MATAVRHLNGMSEKAQACLQNAAQCERAAVLAAEPDARATYRDLARQWREMVEHYEELNRLRGGDFKRSAVTRSNRDIVECDRRGRIFLLACLRRRTSQ
jgi:hypothetical protein